VVGFGEAHVLLANAAANLDIVVPLMRIVELDVKQGLELAQVLQSAVVVELWERHVLLAYAAASMDFVVPLMPIVEQDVNQDLELAQIKVQLLHQQLFLTINLYNANLILDTEVVG